VQGFFFKAGGRSIMTKTSSSVRHCLQRIALVLLFSTAAYSASAQVITGLLSKPKISVFGTFTDIKPDLSYYGDYAVYGMSGGGFIQSRHIIGGEVRGSITRWGGLEHQETALGGPRAALHLGYLSPYICVLGGAGSVWWWDHPVHSNQPRPKLDYDIGPEWSGIGGIDVHVSHHIAIRAGEFSYSKIYTRKTLTPISASVGIVYRLY
jgi:hypothetical protein